MLEFSKLGEGKVRDHIPLEQGLRQGRHDRIHDDEYGQRPYSIRTRIKTLTSSSRRTSSRVRDHIPLEQGLRLFPLFRSAQNRPVRDHIPLEQGLRPLPQARGGPQESSETIFH